MKVEIYYQIPQSGSVIERRFDASGACTWIRFDNDVTGVWAGVFGNSHLVRHSKAVVFGDDRAAMIIAGGQGYVVDARTGELLHKTKDDCFCDAITVPGRDFVIACDFTDLFAVSAQGVIWRSPRIATDGIKLNVATDQMLSGTCRCGAADGRESVGWASFVLHFDGWCIEGNTCDES